MYHHMLHSEEMYLINIINNNNQDNNFFKVKEFV